MAAGRAGATAGPGRRMAHAGSPDSFGANIAAFRQGLAETGYIEDQNVSYSPVAKRAMTMMIATCIAP